MWGGTLNVIDATTPDVSHLFGSYPRSEYVAEHEVPRRRRARLGGHHRHAKPSWIRLSWFAGNGHVKDT
jgi:hypothetical protein